MDPADHRVAHLAMGVAHDDEVGLPLQAGKARRHVLGTDPGGIVGRFPVEAAVHEHDDQVRARGGAASSTGAALRSIGATRATPATLARSQTMTPGVVKPVTPTRTPPRSARRTVEAEGIAGEAA